MEATKRALGLWSIRSGKVGLWSSLYSIVTTMYLKLYAIFLGTDQTNKLNTWTCSPTQVRLFDRAVLWTRKDEVIFLSQAEKAAVGDRHVARVGLLCQAVITVTVVTTEVS